MRLPKNNRRRRPRRQPVALRLRKRNEERILVNIARLILNAAAKGFNIINLEPVTTAAPGGAYRTDLVLMCSLPHDRRYVKPSPIARPQIIPPKGGLH